MDNRTGISPQNRYFAPAYRSTQCCSDLLSLSLLISMATVKSLTSTPGLEGSLLRCQGHIGRSDRPRLREGRKTRWRVGRRDKDTGRGGGAGGEGSVCIMCVCVRVRACVCVYTCMHVRACERERQRESSAPWVGSGIPVHLDPYRYTVPYRGNPYRCTRYYRRVPPALL